MALMRTSNPVLNDNAFRSASFTYDGTQSQTMTISGTVNKTGILLLCAIATAAWSWNQFTHSPEMAGPLVLVGAIGGLIFALATSFKPNWAPITAPLYALLEGLVLGGISAMFDKTYHGIAIQAVALTFGTLLALLAAYRTGIIRATAGFKMGVIAATGGIALFYFLSFILGFFGIHFTSIYGAGPIGIGFSVIVVIVAALNLVLDFDFIENASRGGSPKYMEWYGAFGLMVTLVWLYLEILRLLAKLQQRRD